LGKKKKYTKLKRESWNASTLTKAAQTRKRAISPPGELTQASYISLEQDNTSEVGLGDVLIAQTISLSLEREST